MEPETGLPERRLSGALLYRPAAHLLLIALIGLLAYSNTFEASFHFDDTRNIVANALIRDFSNFIDPSAAREHPYYNDFKMRNVGFLSFALNYKLHGLDVTGFHILNLTIHVLNGFLVYFLVVVTFMTPRMRSPASTGAFPARGEPDCRLLIGLFSALLFVSHPIQTQAVTYIVQRFASLATMFYMTAILAYARYRLLLQHRPAAAWCCYVLALVCTLLAMKTKEISFTIPITISLYELMFFDGQSGSPKRRFAFLLPFLLTFAVIPLSAINLDSHSGPLAEQLAEKSRVLTTLSRKDYFLTQLTVIPVYMRLIFMPVGQNLDYDHPIYTAILNPRVALSSLLLLSVLLIGVWSLRVSRTGDRRWRLVSFGIFWFLVTLLPESSLIPIVDVIYEHRAYLPSVGAFVSIVSCVFLLGPGLRSNRSRAMKATLLALAGGAVVLAAATYARNNVWKNERALWEDVVRKSPYKERARNTLGSVYLDTGELDLAHEELRRTLVINPYYWPAQVNLGTCYMEKARAALHKTESSETALALVEKAIACYEKALALGPDTGMVLSLLDSAHRRYGSIVSVHQRRPSEASLP